MEEGDRVFTQSGSILRYLGRKYDLAGDNEFEAFQCDESLEIVSDFREEVKDKIGKTHTYKHMLFIAHTFCNLIYKLGFFPDDDKQTINHHKTAK